MQGSTRNRYVGSLRFQRPLTETFDEFLIVHLKYTLGKRWGRSQVKLPRDQQHKIIQWIFDISDEKRRILGNDHDSNAVVAAKPTGTVLELLSVADDVYRLTLVDQLPGRMLKRLRKRESFQGARYEIALAASFVRSGFDIRWLEEEGKHAEFVATLPSTNDEIVVEGKSRRRTGILHEAGLSPDFDDVQADVNNLYRAALKKLTDSKPFLISLDVNLPQSINPLTGREKWLPDVGQLLNRHPEPTREESAKEFCLVFTNFNWHYSGSDLAPPHQVVYTFPQWCTEVPSHDTTFTALIQAFDRYGRRPEGVF